MDPTSNPPRAPSRDKQPPRDVQKARGPDGRAASASYLVQIAPMQKPTRLYAD
jgi:hypothetical protein